MSRRGAPADRTSRFRKPLDVVCGTLLFFRDGGRMLIDLWDDREQRGSKALAGGPNALLFNQLAELVGARKDRGEIARVLDHLAMRSNDARGRELRDGVVLAIARGLRRSGGRIGSGMAATSPGARLLAGLIDESKATAFDERGTETAAFAGGCPAGHARTGRVGCGSYQADGTSGTGGRAGRRGASAGRDRFNRCGESLAGSAARI